MNREWAGLYIFLVGKSRKFVRRMGAEFLLQLLWIAPSHLLVAIFEFIVAEQFGPLRHTPSARVSVHRKLETDI